jgi:Fe-S-cluster containining protein
MTYRLAVIQGGYESFDTRMKDLIALAREEGHAIPCKRGCSHCCSDVALVTQFDMPPLIECIRALPKSEQNRIRARIVVWHTNVSSKGIHPDNAEPEMARYHAAPKARCPILNTETNECRAYRGRPPACRGHVVIDQEASVCANRAENPEVQCLSVEDEICRLTSFTIGHSLPNGPGDVYLLVLMLPAMLARAWSLVEDATPDYSAWFASIERRAKAGERV